MPRRMCRNTIVIYRTGSDANSVGRWIGNLLLSLVFFACLSSCSGDGATTIAPEGVSAAPDGTVQQVADHLRKTALAPGEELEPVHWSGLQKKADFLGDTSYTVSVIYRVKTANGAGRMESKTFTLDRQGMVLFEFDVEPFRKK